jgi:ketosteroid isomerase-like protein
MPRPRPPPAAPASPDDIETQFYEALQHADIESLMAVWSDDDDIVCVHPGGPRVIGPIAVRASFEAMFGNGSIDAHPERVRRLQGAACAVHSVLEHVRVGTAKGPRSAWVLATNVYVQTARGWRLVAHHASPGSEREIQELLEAGSTIH